MTDETIRSLRASIVKGKRVLRHAGRTFRTIEAFDAWLEESARPAEQAEQAEPDSSALPPIPMPVPVASPLADMIGMAVEANAVIELRQELIAKEQELTDLQAQHAAVLAENEDLKTANADLHQANLDLTDALDAAQAAPKPEEPAPAVEPTPAVEPPTEPTPADAPATEETLAVEASADAQPAEETGVADDAFAGRKTKKTQA